MSPPLSSTVKWARIRSQCGSVALSVKSMRAHRAAPPYQLKWCGLGVCRTDCPKGTCVLTQAVGAHENSTVGNFTATAEQGRKGYARNRHKCLVVLTGSEAEGLKGGDRQHVLSALKMVLISRWGCRFAVCKV